MEKAQKSFLLSPYFLGLSAVVLMMLVLRLSGRIWWCKYGGFAIYVNEAWSSHTSQHVFDPYSLTHILHGVVLFWAAALIFKKASIDRRFLFAVGAEVSWELFENSSYVIRQYRENTASLDYFGDTIANSLGDVAATAAGFWIAARIGWRLSVALFLLIELILILWIRDSLLLNVLMLIYPVDWIKAWQAAV